MVFMNDKTNELASESYQINQFDSFCFHLAGTFEFRRRFKGASGATCRQRSWPLDQRPTMRIDGGGRGLLNKPSFATNAKE